MKYDIIIKNGNVYDGTGSEPNQMDIAIKEDKIVKIGIIDAEADRVIDATGLAVSPGFINMLSWSVESLIEDGRSMGEIVQGVTLEVMGEGWSWGPLNDRMKEDIRTLFSSEIKYDITWVTLGEYLEFLEKKGVSTNIASFLGATTVRMHELGNENRKPTTEELVKMKNLVHHAMKEGAMGLASALIYPPAFFSDEQEIIELNKVVAEYGGMYITHMRSESNKILEGVEETINVARETGVNVEIYHLKQAGEKYWDRLDPVIEKIEKAREEGIKITTDMYTYTAAGTSLSSCLPPNIQDGGREAMYARLSDNSLRMEMKKEMALESEDWENLYYLAGPENIQISSLKKEELKPLMGRTIKDIADEENKDPRDTIIDLILKERGMISCVYHLMSENNVKRQIQLPYMSFGSDAESMAPEGVFLKSSTHPRAYGNFSRLLGKYVRDEKVISLENAIHKLTGFPASNLGLKDRGLLKETYFADIAIFDPDKIKDNATFDDPHQLSEGMEHVIVNGKIVLHNGEHTGATPGRFVRGPGYHG
jgi:N-acyl-D-amino-acid deacylase